MLRLEPKHPLSGPRGSLTTPGARAALSLLMVKWTGSCFHPHVAEASAGSPGGWAGSWTSGPLFDSIEFLLVVTLGLPTCPPWASVPTSLQGEDWAGQH